MKKKIAFWMLAAFAAFSTFGDLSKMASQPWVKMVVSNETETTKAWVGDYIRNSSKFGKPLSMEVYSEDGERYVFTLEPSIVSAKALEIRESNVPGMEQGTDFAEDSFGNFCNYTNDACNVITRSVYTNGFEISGNTRYEYVTNGVSVVTNVVGDVTNAVITTKIEFTANGHPYSGIADTSGITLCARTDQPSDDRIEFITTAVREEVRRILTTPPSEFSLIELIFPSARADWIEGEQVTTREWDEGDYHYIEWEAHYIWDSLYVKELSSLSVTTYDQSGNEKSKVNYDISPAIEMVRVEMGVDSCKVKTPIEVDGFIGVVKAKVELALTKGEDKKAMQLFYKGYFDEQIRSYYSEAISDPVGPYATRPLVCPNKGIDYYEKGKPRKVYRFHPDEICEHNNIKWNCTSGAFCLNCGCQLESGHDHPRPMTDNGDTCAYCAETFIWKGKTYTCGFVSTDWRDHHYHRENGGDASGCKCDNGGYRQPHPGWKIVTQQSGDRYIIDDEWHYMQEECTFCGYTRERVGTKGRHIDSQPIFDWIKTDPVFCKRGERCGYCQYNYTNYIVGAHIPSETFDYSVFLDDWQYDETNHWKIAKYPCSRCGRPAIKTSIILKDEHDFKNIGIEDARTNHFIKARCEDCKHEVYVPGLHNYATLYYTNINNETHQEVQVCVTKFNNPGCGHTNVLAAANHDGPLIGIDYYDNLEHVKTYQCVDCRGHYFEAEIHTPWLVEDKKWSSHEYIGAITNILDGCVWGGHTASSTCPKCFSTVHDDMARMCDPVWDYSTRFIDTATCKLCGGMWSTLCHSKVVDDHLEGVLPLDSTSHACWHTATTSGGAMQSEPHLIFPHNMDGWVDGDGFLHEGWCSVCGYSSFGNVFKYTAPFVNDGQFIRAFTFSGYEKVDIKDPVYEVGNGGFEQAFMWSQNIASADCGEVTNAHDRAFLESFACCPSLKVCDFGKLIVSGEESFFGAFSNCISMTDFNINGLKEAGVCSFCFAFFNCSNLSSIQLPNLEVANERAFESAFNGSRIRTVSAPCLKSIGRMAFANCNGVSAFECGSSLTNIDEFAFNGCSDCGLFDFRTSVSIPNLASANAFDGVAQGYVVVVPQSLYDDWKTNGEWSSVNVVNESEWRRPRQWNVALNVPSGTTIAPQVTIPVEGMTMTWDWGDGTIVSNLTSSPSPHTYTTGGDYKIFVSNAAKIAGRPESYKSWLGFDAIYSSYSYVEKVRFGNELKEIGDYAFRSQQNLHEVEAQSVTNIGEDAFRFCDALEIVSFKNAITIGASGFRGSGIKWCDFSNLEEVGEYCFSGDEIEGYNFQKLRVLGENSFESSGIKSADFPCAEELGLYCFSRCKEIKVVRLPKLKKVHPGAFEECCFAQIETSGDVEFTKENISPYLYEQGNYHFVNCTNLFAASFQNATSVPNFSRCDKLKSITLPYTIEDPTLGDRNFYMCQIGEIPRFVSERVYDIPNNCFMSCTNLTSVNLVVATNINEGAFYNCNNISSLIISNARNLCPYSFESCSELVDVTAPKVEKIDCAFVRCGKLKHLNLPKCTVITNSLSDNTYYPYAFYGTPLESLGLGALTIDEVENQFQFPFGLQQGCVIHCKDGDITVP